MEAKSVKQSEQFKVGEIMGVVVRDLRRFNDKRGWLTELFRHDELDEEYYPLMTYISATEPGVTRGPHATTKIASPIRHTHRQRFRGITCLWGSAASHAASLDVRVAL